MQTLDNPRMEGYFPLAYYLNMSGESFRDRILAALKAQKMSKAELSRRSGVKYHALDKFLKGISQTTGYENGRALAQTLGIETDEDDDFEKLREIYYALDEEGRRYALKSLRGLAED